MLHKWSRYLGMHCSFTFLWLNYTALYALTKYVTSCLSMHKSEFFCMINLHSKISTICDNFNCLIKHPILNKILQKSKNSFFSDYRDLLFVFSENNKSVKHTKRLFLVVSEKKKFGYLKKFHFFCSTLCHKSNIALSGGVSKLCQLLMLNKNVSVVWKWL